MIVGAGAGGDEGTGAATACGTGVVSRDNGVSAGLTEVVFLGVFSGVGVFFFFLALAGVSLVLVFFLLDFGFAVASGVSFGVAAGPASSRVSFDFVFGFGDGEPGFDLCFAVFLPTDGLGDASGVADAEARALRNSARFSFSSSLT